MDDALMHLTLRTHHNKNRFGKNARHVRRKLTLRLNRGGNIHFQTNELCRRIILIPLTTLRFYSKIFYSANIDFILKKRNNFPVRLYYRGIYSFEDL